MLHSAAVNTILKQDFGAAGLKIKADLLTVLEMVEFLSSDGVYRKIH